MFFRDGGESLTDFEYRWFFYHVRQAILQFRRHATTFEYDPWNDTLLDLGAPDEIDCDDTFMTAHEDWERGIGTWPGFMYGSEVEGGYKGPHSSYHSLQGRETQSRDKRDYNNDENTKFNTKGNKRESTSNNNGMGIREVFFNGESMRRKNEHVGITYRDPYGGIQSSTNFNERSNNREFNRNEFTPRRGEMFERRGEGSSTRFRSDDESTDYMRPEGEWDKQRSPTKSNTVMGERIRFSEVELKEASPQALRDFITK